MDKVGEHERAVDRIRFRIWSLPWGKGLNIKKMPKARCPYDLLIGGKVKLEVKTCIGSLSTGGWKFNLHRHGIVNPEGLDLYTLVIPPIELLGFRRFTILIVPKEEVAGVFTLGITPRTLMLRWGTFFNRWDLIQARLGG